MEPSAKRMRIWQSVEVDEENVEYIKAKQKQQQKFKGRLESIFEKYGNMHESMSDEIDMTTNRVVVDRGHLRRLKRQVGRKETMLLDTLGLAVEKELEQESEEEENGEDSEDELAPVQPGKSNKQPELDGQGPDHDAQSPRSDNVSSVPQPMNDPATSIPHVGTIQTPNKSNSAPNLLPLVQFPQTPAGQQAQTTFYLTLTQGISEVIQKAMVQSGLLPPNFPSPFANAAPLPTTPITTADRIAPATDPKWFFPPLSATRQDRVAQSSPLPAGPPAEKANQAINTTIPYEPEGQVSAESTPLVNEASPMVSRAMLEVSSPTRCRRTSPRVEIQKRRIRPARKYQFTADDDVYISKRKTVDQLSWAAIKRSQEKWKDWPVSALSRRWAVIKDQNLHLQTPVLARLDENIHDADHGLEEAQTVTQSHHLPTPISSEHEDGQKEEELTENAKGFPSSAYFDEDERELLSLAGTDVEDQDEDQEEDQDQDHDQLHLSSDDEATDLVSEDGIILSIETPDLPAEEPSGLVDEDDLQRELLENLPMQDATISPPRQLSVQVKAEPGSPSPIITHTQDALPRRFETVPDSDSLEDTANDSPAHQESPPLPPPSSLNDPVCNRASKSPQSLVHTVNLRNTHTHPASAPIRRKSPSLDLIAGDDDLLPIPTTPVKREPSTPSSTSFFVSGFQTPKATVRQRGSSFVEGERGTEKSERVSVKQLKRCWKGTGTPAASAKKGKRVRESLGVVARSGKKVKVGFRERESEERDELCF